MPTSRDLGECRGSRSGGYSLDVRYRTVRRYKSEEGMMNELVLLQRVRSGQEGLDLGELIAA